jgi:hypothetical protein
VATTYFDESKCSFSSGERHVGRRVYNQRQSLLPACRWKGSEPRKRRCRSSRCIGVELKWSELCRVAVFMTPRYAIQAASKTVVRFNTCSIKHVGYAKREHIIERRGGGGASMPGSSIATSIPGHVVPATCCLPRMR